jgi:hypothetical protein
MTYTGIFDEIDCKKELERAKRFIKKQENIILALEKEIEQNRYRLCGVLRLLL